MPSKGIEALFLPAFIAIERGTVVVAGFRAVAQIPPEKPVELRLHELGQAVRHEQAVDEARGLFAGIGGNRIVFGAEQFNVGAIGTDIIGDHLPQIRGVGRPSGRGSQQPRVVLAARILRRTMVDGKVRRDAQAG